jgi:hypothetical protein
MILVKTPIFRLPQKWYAHDTGQTLLRRDFLPLVRQQRKIPSRLLLAKTHYLDLDELPLPAPKSRKLLIGCPGYHISIQLTTNSWAPTWELTASEQTDLTICVLSMWKAREWTLTGSKTRSQGITWDRQDTMAVLRREGTYNRIVQSSHSTPRTNSNIFSC